MKTLDHYTLSELSAELGLSHAWVKKIEKGFKLPAWGSGQRGKKSYYSLEHYDFFKKITTLRKIGLGIEDIKKIYKAEKEIFQFVKKEFSVGSSKNLKHISFYLINSVFCDTEGLEYDRDEYKRNKRAAEHLDKLYKNYREEMKTILGRLNDTMSTLRNEKEQVKAITG